jgi:hypothetical protein
MRGTPFGGQTQLVDPVPPEQWPSLLSQLETAFDQCNQAVALRLLARFAKTKELAMEARQHFRLAGRSLAASRPGEALVNRRLAAELVRSNSQWKLRPARFNQKINP